MVHLNEDKDQRSITVETSSRSNESTMQQSASEQFAIDLCAPDGRQVAEQCTLRALRALLTIASRQGQQLDNGNDTGNRRDTRRQSKFRQVVIPRIHPRSDAATSPVRLRFVRSTRSHVA